MVLYYAKSVNGTAFVSRGVLYDLMKTNNGKAKLEDIKSLTFNDYITDEYPAHIYKDANDNYTLTPTEESTAIDVILQKYPARDEYNEVLMEKVKGKKYFTCKLPVNANRNGYLSADEDGNDTYMTDTKFYPIPGLRVGLAKVKVVDEVNKIVEGSMYTYYLPTTEDLISIWKELRGLEANKDEIHVVPVYEFVGENIGFSVIQTLKSTFIIFNIVNDDSTDVMVLDYADLQYYTNDLEAISFARDIHNMNGKRKISYYTTPAAITKVKKYDKLYNKFKDVSTMKMGQLNQRYKGTNNDIYQFVKVEDTSLLIENNKDLLIGRLFKYGLIDVYAYRSDSKSMYYLKLCDQSHPMHEAVWANIYNITGDKVFEVLNQIVAINKNSMNNIR